MTAADEKVQNVELFLLCQPTVGRWSGQGLVSDSALPVQRVTEL